MRINNFQCAGNLVRDPEIAYTTSGAMLAKFSVAINPTSEKGETLFMDCTAWQQKAEIAHKLLKQGMEVYLEGPLQLQKWTGHDGKERSKTAMTVFNIQIPRGQTHSAQASSAPAAIPENRPYTPPEPVEPDDSTDDLPF